MMRARRRNSAIQIEASSLTNGLGTAFSDNAGSVGRSVRRGGDRAMMMYRRVLTPFVVFKSPHSQPNRCSNSPEKLTPLFSSGLSSIQCRVDIFCCCFFLGICSLPDDAPHFRLICCVSSESCFGFGSARPGRRTSKKQQPFLSATFSFLHPHRAKCGAALSGAIKQHLTVGRIYFASVRKSNYPLLDIPPARVVYCWFMETFFFSSLFFFYG